MKLFDRIKRYLIDYGFIPQPKISLLIPFSTDNAKRLRNFKWLLKYWKCQLPHAEIVVGHSSSKVFCKGEALNNALERANGRILVVLDADAYLSGEIISYCANRILEEEYYGHNLWYVPYRFLYRLTEDITERIIKSDPCDPVMPSTPPQDCHIENNGDIIHYGHMYGAMITIFPRRALEVIKCFDEHFVGWGGEDISFLRAMDTLFGRHKTTNNAVFHLWHPYHGKTHRERTWDNQERPNMYWRRTSRYHHATGKISKMKELMDENYGYYKSRRKN